MELGSEALLWQATGPLSQRITPGTPRSTQAVFTASGQYYYHRDHLGSFRFASTSNRAMYFDLAYAPFGEVYANSGSTDPGFTSQRQDTVSRLSDFLAREYSDQGRWASPDPAGLAAVASSNPQSWNRYGYVYNSPLNFIDPVGLYVELVCTYWSISYGLIDMGHGQVCFMWENGIQQLPLTLTPPELAANLRRVGNTSGNNKTNQLKGFNACVDQAASVRNRQLLGTTGEIIAGGLVFVTVGWVTIESGGALIHEMAADAASSAPESGFLLFSAATSDLPHVGLMATAATGGTALMAHGSAGELNALNQYDRAVGNCQVKYGFPNVP